MFVRFVLRPEGGVILHWAKEGETFGDALLSHGINPDTILLRCGNIYLPVDRRIGEEEEVEVLFTCSRG